jgi:hypothetical protein
MLLLDQAHSLESFELGQCSVEVALKMMLSHSSLDLRFADVLTNPSAR